MSTSTSSKNHINNLSLELLTSAFEASRSPLIITDYALPDNPIVYSNNAFTDLTGYLPDEIIGTNCRFLQGKNADAEVVTELRNAVKNGTGTRVTLKNYKKDGTAFWNDLVLSPVKDNDGNTTHFMGMQLDVTERIETELNLLSKTEELTKLNHELEQFTYATSHDLQEPLRMVHSYIQLLNKRYASNLDDDAQTFLGFATEGAERMQSLITDLLTLSRVTDNSQRTKDVGLKDITNRAVANLKSTIDESKAKIIISELPIMRVDPVQITQLMQNLIANAIKYRAPGKQPTVTISAVSSSQEHTVTVEDNGIGIAPQHLERIFIVFQRLHTRSEYPGTGVGLAICSKVVDRHNGKIWAESTGKNGSKFKFSIPIEKGRK